MTARMPVYFVSHGGGPWPYMQGEFRQHYAQLEASLIAMRTAVGSMPRAVLVVTAHWETANFRFSSHPQPGMVYDYQGFPEETYHVVYPAPGQPELAQHAATLLQDGGVSAQLDEQRGFDHGTFAVLAALYPDAKVPVVQMSIRQDFDVAAHLAAGRLLAPLRNEGVLIIGSGLSYHNLRRFGSVAYAPSKAFDDWLQETLMETSPQQRQQRLLDWQQAPAARLAHPREDHLLPLMVAVGAGGEEAVHCVYHEEAFMGVAVSSFRFG